MAAPDTDFITPIRGAVGPAAVSVVYDGVAGPTLNGSLELLRPRGTISVHSLKATSIVLTSPSLPHFTSDPAD